jgi:peptide chain release factor 1
LFEQFRGIEDRFNDIERKMSDPEVISDQAAYQDLVKRRADIEEGVMMYRRYVQLTKELADAKELLKDPDMKEMAESEVASLSEALDAVNEELQIYLLPKDPDDSKNVLVEVRSGTGGEEAALFAAELYRMYVRYAESRGWKTEVMSENLTEMGGVKEIVFSIAGNGVFGQLKFESGTHRVQRVPATESAGRVHTSAATVAIMPEAEDVDIQIEQKDLRIDTFRASGAGGQHVNKTSSAIRITHIPTNVVVTCQDERSQFQNKDKAMRMLRARLYEQHQEEARAKNASLRKSQVGSGDRSEKIRTYNFPQNRVTDHRIHLTLHTMQDVLSGKMDPLIDALVKADRMEKMKAT